MGATSPLVLFALLLPPVHAFLGSSASIGSKTHTRTSAPRNNAAHSSASLFFRHKRRAVLDTSLFSATIAEDTSDSYAPPDLAGRVAIVTGASRGIGKGVAL